jgi:transcriptional regulator with XRE-family HTH domain
MYVTERSVTLNNNSTVRLQPHELLKILRLRKGLNQEGLALVLNCSQMHVSRIERGIAEPDYACKRAINRYLGEIVWTIDNEGKENENL